MKSEELARKMYASEIVGPSRKGRSLGRWKDRVKEYMCERGVSRGRGLEQLCKKGVFG